MSLQSSELWNVSPKLVDEGHNIFRFSEEKKKTKNFHSIKGC